MIIQTGEKRLSLSKISSMKYTNLVILTSRLSQIPVYSSSKESLMLTDVKNIAQVILGVTSNVLKVIYT